MGGVGCISSVDPAWNDYGKRGFLTLHRTNLNRGGVGSKQPVVIEVQRVLAVTCCVVTGDI